MLKKILALVTLSTSFGMDYDALYNSMKSRPEFKPLKKILTQEVNKEYLDSKGKLKPYYQLGTPNNFETRYQSLLYFGYLAAELALTPNNIKRKIKSRSGRKELAKVANNNRLPPSIINYINKGMNVDSITKSFLQRKVQSLKHDTPISTLSKSEKKPIKQHIKDKLLNDIKIRNRMYSNLDIYADVYSKRRNNILNALTSFALAHRLRNENITGKRDLEEVIDNAIYPTTQKIAKIIAGNGVPKLSYGKLVETILNFEIAENGAYNLYQDAGKYGDPAGISYHKIRDLLKFGTDLTKNPIYRIAQKHDSKFKSKVNKFKQGAKAPTITHARINNQRTGLFYSRALALYNNIKFGDLEGTAEMIELIENDSKLRNFANQTDLFLEMSKVSYKHLGKHLNQVQKLAQSVKQLSKSKNKKERQRGRKIKNHYLKFAQSNNPDIRAHDASTFLLTKVITDYIIATKGTQDNFGQLYRRFNGGESGAREIFEFEEYLIYALKNNISANQATEKLHELIGNIRHPKKIDYYYRNCSLSSYIAKKVYYPQLENLNKK